jgi:hypothetical protein
MKENINSFLNDFSKYFVNDKGIDILPNKDVPIDKTTFIFAHNAFNSAAYGNILPNQQLSLTELADLGSRGFEWDLHWSQDAIRTCHMVCANWGLGTNNPFSSALVELATWLQQHPEEVIFLKLEDHLDNAPKDLLTKTILDTFSEKEIFTPGDLENVFSNKWPSLNQIRDLGKRVIIMPQNTEDNPLLFPAGWGGKFKNDRLTGTIARVRENNYSVPKTGLQLSEVGEDRAPLGTLANMPRKIPFLRYLVPDASSAGHMSKEDVMALKKQGVNIISMDQLTPNDYRLREHVLISDIPRSPYFFIPAAVVAAAFTASKAKDTTFKSNIQKSIVASLVYSTLPEEGYMIFLGAEKGIQSYKDYIKEREKSGEDINASDYIKAVEKSITPTLGGMAEGGLRILASNPIGLPYYSGALPTSIEGASKIGSNVFNIAANIIPTKLMLDPFIGATKGAFGYLPQNEDEKKEDQKPKTFKQKLGRVFSNTLKGFVKGVESSMFNQVDFSPPPDFQRKDNNEKVLPENSDNNIESKQESSKNDIDLAKLKTTAEEAEQSIKEITAKTKAKKYGEGLKVSKDEEKGIPKRPTITKRKPNKNIE